MLTAVSCGPELTEPGSSDLTGTWLADAPVGVIKAISLTLAQDQDGTLSGAWIGSVTPPIPSCPPELSNQPTGTVFGTNTVLEVEFEILGAGHFNGQALETGLMRGYVFSCSIYFPITFHRTGPPALPVQ